MFTPEEKKAIIISLLAFLLFSFCCSLASPQTYKVTEQQLLELEMYSNSLKTNNLLLQSQVQKLKAESKTLNEQLSKEREQSRELSKSCAELDLKLSKEHQTMAELNDSLHKEQLSKQKYIKWLVISCAVNFVLLGSLVFFILWKIKR